MLIKNHPGFLLPKLFRRMALDGIAALKFLVEGKWKFFWVVFLAHVAIYANFSKMYQKRRALKKYKKKPQGIYLGSILWVNFIQRVNVFSALNQQKWN
jgi:hypothetical protein